MRKALVVGVSDYLHLDDAPGSSVAAAALARSLSEGCEGDPRETGWDPLTVLASKPGEPLTGRALHEGLTATLKGCTELLFYFSGHGLAVPAKNDLWLASSEHEPFGPDAGLSLSAAMNQIALTPTMERATIILDCTNSAVIRTMAVPDGQIVMTVAEAVDRDGGWLAPREQLAFSDALREGLDGEAKDAMGKITVLSLFAYASKRLSDSQRWEPILVGRMVGARLLRQVKGLGLEEISRLPEVFTEADAVVGVSPDHEWPTVAEVRAPYEFRSRPQDWSEDKLDEYVRTGVLSGSDRDSQRQQQYFKRLRDAGLLRVTRPENQDLFWACLSNEGRVGLTELGRYYWKLAKDKML